MLNKAGEVLSPSATAPPALLAMPVQQQQQQQGMGDPSDFSGFAQLQHQAACTGAASTPTAAAADSSISSVVSSPFGKGLHGQQQQQQLLSSGASDAGLSAISSSTIPGSNSAVAGTPANSIIVSEYLASGSVRGLGLGSSSFGKTPAPASPGVSSSSLQAAGQRNAFFASVDGRAHGAQLHGSSNISRERLAEESVLQWLPASTSLPLAAPPSAGGAAAGSGSVAVGGSSSRDAAAGAAAGSSSVGASRLVQRALYSSGGDKHRYVVEVCITDVLGACACQYGVWHFKYTPACLRSVLLCFCMSVLTCLCLAVLALATHRQDNSYSMCCTMLP
jgi:hypothetical protein